MVYHDWKTYQTALAAYKASKQRHDTELSHWTKNVTAFDRKEDQYDSVESLGLLGCLGAGAFAYYKSCLGNLWLWLILGFASGASYQALDVKCRTYRKRRFIVKNPRPFFTQEEPTFSPTADTDSTQTNSRTNPPPQQDSVGSMTLDHAFAILELPRNATLLEIKNRYRERIREYHPDKVAHLGVELKELAERKSKEINAAYAYASKAAQCR